MTERRAVCVLVYVEDPFRLLVLRRVATRVAGWQPVTGRVETEDASLEAACIREIREETGLEAPLALVDLGRETSFVGYDGATFLQRTFAAAYPAPYAIRLSDEHEEARWVTYEEAMRLLTWEENRGSLAWLRERLGA